jgi:protein-disulfide isomerase
MAVGAAMAAAVTGCGSSDKAASSQTQTTASTATTATESTTTPSESTGLKPAAADISGIAQDGVTLGDPSAPVTLYEFADLQCPFCAEYTQTAFPQVVDQYVKTGKVKVVFRNLTFLGPDSVTAARAASAAGQQDKLWDFVDTFYANQGEENSGYVTDAFLGQVAGAAEADTAQLKQDMQSPAVDKELAEAQKMAKQGGVNSTPAFLIQTGSGQPRPLGNKSADFAASSAALDKAMR